MISVFDMTDEELKEWEIAQDAKVIAKARLVDPKDYPTSEIDGKILLEAAKIRTDFNRETAAEKIIAKLYEEGYGDRNKDIVETRIEMDAGPWYTDYKKELKKANEMLTEGVL